MIKQSNIHNITMIIIDVCNYFKVNEIKTIKRF